MRLYDGAVAVSLQKGDRSRQHRRPVDARPAAGSGHVDGYSVDNQSSTGTHERPGVDGDGHVVPVAARRQRVRVSAVVAVYRRNDERRRSTGIRDSDGAADELNDLNGGGRLEEDRTVVGKVERHRSAAARHGVPSTGDRKYDRRLSTGGDAYRVPGAGVVRNRTDDEAPAPRRKRKQLCHRLVDDGRRTDGDASVASEDSDRRCCADDRTREVRRRHKSNGVEVEEIQLYGIAAVEPHRPVVNGAPEVVWKADLDSGRPLRSEDVDRRLTSGSEAGIGGVLRSPGDDLVDGSECVVWQTVETGTGSEIDRRDDDRLRALQYDGSTL